MGLKFDRRYLAAGIQHMFWFSQSFLRQPANMDRWAADFQRMWDMGGPL